MAEGLLLGLAGRTDMGWGQNQTLIPTPHLCEARPIFRLPQRWASSRVRILYFLSSKWPQHLKKVSTLIWASVSLSVKWGLAGLPSD